MPGRCETIHGDSIEVLRTLEPDSVDSVTTDPPYGMSDHDAEDVGACLRAWIAGEEYQPKQRGGFMGRAWDAWVPGPELWREVFRVLKPGGYVLAFASTRTADLMGMALRIAGFRAIDTIHWLHGQGFPKSMDISKAIDRAAGAEREVVGSKIGLPGYHLSPHDGGEAFGHGLSSSTYETRLKASTITAPATDAAKKWGGWGTQLKPAVEPVLVFQKPIAERTIVANVLAHETGGMNIDGCRVAGPKPEPTRGAGGRNGRYGPIGAQGRILDDGKGRFPANIILSHAPGCREVGTRALDGDPRDTGDRLGGSRPGGFANVGSTNGDGTPTGRVYGAETIATWVCEPGCPVAELDAQSGERTSNPRKGGSYRGMGYQGAEARAYPELVGDTGGASRFFYTAKASTAERNRGLPPNSRNEHPTVKPVALMRWLVRLVTPSGGVVLDPFMGSGTTGIATRLEGFGFVGIERDEVSHATASARVAAWREYEDKPKKPRKAPAKRPQSPPRERVPSLQMVLFGSPVGGR